MESNDFITLHVAMLKEMISNYKYQEFENFWVNIHTDFYVLKRLLILNNLLVIESKCQFSINSIRIPEVAFLPIAIQELKYLYPKESKIPPGHPLRYIKELICRVSCVLKLSKKEMKFCNEIYEKIQNKDYFMVVLKHLLDECEKFEKR